MQRRHELTIADLIEICELDQRYVAIFAKEKLTSVAAFKQFLALNNSGLTSTFLERT